MATAVSYSKTGTKQDKTVSLEKAIFGVEANQELVGQAYRTYLANGRVAGPKTLKRGEVAGGGKKPWRQKGTGRARVGSIRVPNWKGGGVVFGPTGAENHTITMPTRMKRLAIRHALSLQAQSGQIAVIEDFTSTDGKVKPTVELLTKLKLTGAVVLVVAEKNELLERATRNIQGLQLVSAKYLNVYTVMNADHLVLTSAALTVVNDWLGEK
ncbi:MAG: ribosomal protein [Candidatus Saccharibacteria bacterium]|jgi:large subunit ribosomal protein L4|nr:ribosomal protein [Candidatus Saccharibacteria bacterium]